MADEMVLRANEGDKGRVNTAEESSARARGGEFMWLRSESHDWVTNSCKSLLFLTGNCTTVLFSKFQNIVPGNFCSSDKCFFIGCFHVVQCERSAAFLLRGFLMCCKFDLKHELKISSDLLMWVAVQPNERICLGETREQNLKNAWRACRPYFSIS